MYLYTYTYICMYSLPSIIRSPLGLVALISTLFVEKLEAV